MGHLTHKLPQQRRFLHSNSSDRRFSSATTDHAPFASLVEEAEVGWSSQCCNFLLGVVREKSGTNCRTECTLLHQLLREAAVPTVEMHDGVLLDNTHLELRCDGKVSLISARDRNIGSRLRNREYKVVTCFIHG